MTRRDPSDLKCRPKEAGRDAHGGRREAWDSGRSRQPYKVRAGLWMGSWKPRVRPVRRAETGVKCPKWRAIWLGFRGCK
jgi:hypothetical protein